VNDPAVLPRQWPQTVETGSFTPSLVVPHVAVSRAQFVPDERAARMHMFVSTFAGMTQPVIRSEIGSRASQYFPEERRIHGVGYRAPHHRVFDVGAVLSVNTRPWTDSSRCSRRRTTLPARSKQSAGRTWLDSWR
jgi:hypothetical protein